MAVDDKIQHFCFYSSFYILILYGIYPVPYPVLTEFDFPCEDCISNKQLFQAQKQVLLLNTFLIGIIS